MKRVLTLLAAAGPGIVVMLADTDVGSLVTAAQSGAKWGYSLLALQFLLIPVLFVVQELTARLGTATGKGHGTLILERYGRFWAWLSFGGLLLAGIGAIATEFSGIAGIGDLWGVPRLVSLGVPALLLLLIVLTGSYERVERISILVGLFELSFLLIAWRAHPDPQRIVRSLAHPPLGNSDYRVLVAANIGAVIMPWMIFFQQSAVADKGLKREQRRGARWDTLIGATVSQLVMGALLVAAAATLYGKGDKNGLQTVGDLAHAFTPALGPFFGQAVLGVGILSAAFVSLNVVSLALAWGFGDVTGQPHSLRKSPREAPVFYGIYALAVVGGAILVQLVRNLVALNVAVEVMNALLLPLALGLLVLLATRALPDRDRVRGGYALLVYAVAGLAILFGLIGGLDEIGLF
ncbi:Nramp family divalent metal transporter [Rhizosaccharibacter radicis]|uniref:Nramp family divalent metal transporter n=1 Tax=Rhizosaccharibacter radicis TaxID=2782605 RepID=A0ABT1W0C0_9PROT|nr:Nramp family divalent metal transporter [Acetobacteraceae bacterium KSS12]